MSAYYSSTDKKGIYMPTSHKSNVYEPDFSSIKKDPPTMKKSGVNPLADSQKDEIKNRSLFSEDRKENENIFIQLTNRTYTQEQVDRIKAEDRMEMEKLLLEISRLHDIINDQEKTHKYELERLKEDF